MRGKPVRVFNADGGRGLIPAHAGKTSDRQGSRPRIRAHPRACGENPYLQQSYQRRGGSSPRMRGKQHQAGFDEHRRGLIPAHAGKTAAASLGSVTRGAHPRACGENSAHSQPLVSAGGSSPRMRGKLHDSRMEWRKRGLIPAHAGKTIPKNPQCFHHGAHPRACGENLTIEIADSLREGSSPRMRGKLAFLPVVPAAVGLIPAHAGKTGLQSSGDESGWAHPRACGENQRTTRWSTSDTGSSPRMRGKPYASAYSYQKERLIPAHAGKT